MYQLLAELPPERFTAFYDALPEEMRQALDAPVARVLNTRLPSVRRQPAIIRERPSSSSSPGPGLRPLGRLLRGMVQV